MNWLFLLTIFCSLMSQLPYILRHGLDGPLKMTWPMLLASLLLFSFNKILDRRLFFMFVALFSFTTYCGIIEAGTGVHYIGPDFNNMCISALVSITSFIFYTRKPNQTFINNFCIVLIASASILAFFVYKDFLRGYDLMTRLYAYEDKNSLGQILLSCIIICYFCHETNNKLIKITKYLLILSISFVIVLLKSRATFVGMAFCVLYYLYLHKKEKLTITIVLALIIGCVFVIFSSPFLYDTIVNGILFGSRDTASIDDLSSNRITYISESWDIITSHPLWGIGVAYIDCMPISMLLQFGIVGASIVFIYLWCVWKRIKLMDWNNNIDRATFVLFVAFMLNAIFEAQPPFGPGIKCFLLWVMFGFSCARLNTSLIFDKR